MFAAFRRVDAVLIQAVIAAALSFSHIHDLAHRAGQGDLQAWAYPVSVDLLLVAAWVRIRQGRARFAAWFWFVVAMVASLGANLATAGLLDGQEAPKELRLVVAGWPALAFLGGTLLVHSVRKPVSAPETVPEEPPGSTEPETPEEPAEPPTAPPPEPPKAPAPPPVDDVVRVAVAATELGISPATIRGWAMHGKLAYRGVEGRAKLVALSDCRALLT
jgi:hypothetical protein